MKTMFRFSLLILGVVVGVMLLRWYLNGQRLPTLRFSYTLGKGGGVDWDWIELRELRERATEAE